MRLLFASLFLAGSAQWVNKKIVREVSVRDNGIVESTTVYTVARSSDSGEVYKVSIPHASKVGSLRITAGGKDVETKLDSKDDKSDIAVYSVEGVNDNVKVKAFQGHMLSPYPTKIMEMESQQVLLTTVLAVPSQYITDSQSTTVMLPASAGEVVSFRPESGNKLSGRKFEFGPFVDNIPSEDIRIHFGFDNFLPVLSSVVKTVEISQLGQVVAVNEDMVLHNKAAALNGEFNRAPHMHLKYNQGNAPFTLGHTLQAADAIVPITAFDIHYRDVIGNISSSAARRETEFTRVGLRPRFPLLGGWKSEFSFMYNVPFLGKSGDQDWVKQKNGNEFLLAVPLSHSLANVFAENVAVKLILPAGASDIKLSVSGKQVEDFKIEKSFGWLDTPLLGPDSGRTEISFNAGPSVAGEKNTIKPTLFVTYTMSPIALLKAPLLLSAYILALFLVLIFSRRMVLTITNPKEDSEEENKNADHDLCTQIDDELTVLWALTGELLDEVVAHRDNKEQLNKFKQEFNQRFATVQAAVERLTPQFVVENNRFDRTAKLMTCLKTVKESATAILDSVLAGRDHALHAGKMVDAEAEAKIIRDKVEAGAPPSLPNTPSGPQVGKTVTPAATGVKKRR